MNKTKIRYFDGENEIEIDYISRIIDDVIDEYLSESGAILLRGPKWCGKSTTAIKHAKSFIFLSKKSLKPTFDSFRIRPSLFLRGEKPLLLDEWQTYPEIWDLVKDSVDAINLCGQYILTGSYSPKIGTTNHTGSMRIRRLNMTTLTLWEKGISNGSVSLRDIFEGKEIDGVNTLSYEEITHQIVLGGYPASLDREKNNSNFAGQASFESIVESDIQEATGKNLRPSIAKAIIRSLARNISTQVSDQTIISDVSGYESISKNTYYTYYDGLLRLFAIHELESFSPAIRSKGAIRSGPKRQFNDVSLAVAALNLSENDLNNDPRTRGFFFENFVGHDLEVYCQTLRATVGHYRDGLGLEVDFTIHFPNGDYALVEVKSSEVDLLAAKSTFEKFDKLVEKYNSKKGNVSEIRKPRFKMIITGDSPFARKDSDGVYIVPIGTLKP